MAILLSQLTLIAAISAVNLQQISAEGLFLVRKLEN